MKADDTRHGSRTGYQAGCRDECCLRPQRVALKLYRMGRTPRKIDPTGTRRRIEALLAMGWTAKDIAEACGRTSKNWVHEVRKSAQVVETTAIRVRIAYDRMVNETPTSPHVVKVRNVGLANGYHLPNARWDIDDPNEKPDPGYSRRRPHEEVDEVLVDRVLDGDWPLARSASRAERSLITSRWKASGRVLNELDRLTGWKSERYRNEVAS